MVDLAALSDKLTARPDGIWTTDGEEAISYTQDGHEHLQKVESSSIWFEHRLACLKALMRNFPLTGTILDVGGGNGQFSLHLQSENKETVLLEPGAEGAHHAHSAGVQHVIKGSLGEAQFSPDSFDAAVALDVLEHIEEDEAFLKEVHRIMRPSGRLLITVPALQMLFSSFDEEVGHFRRYTLRSLSEVFQRAGFQVDYCTYFFSVLPLPIYLFRILLKRKRKTKDSHLKGHYNRTSLAGVLFKPVQWLEWWLIKNKVRIPIGSSCMVVASKRGAHE